ncbi:MAG: PspA/IM30 family protein [Sphaerochaetaceae bacterium]|nr:PspA/IM30 family protein [Sphaerochaetaceae bacterium]
MGVFSRFKDIINSNINSLLDQAENPEKMISLMVNEMEDTIIELKSACAGSIAAKTKSERELAELEAAVDRWTRRAEMAVQKGMDDLACEAITEKNRVIKRADETRAELAKLSEMIEHYKQDICKLEDKLEATRTKYEKIKADAEAAKAKARAAKTASDASSWDTMDRFNRMEEKIDRLNAEREMREQSANTEKQFRTMEEAEAAKAELEALKERLKGKG